MKEFSAEVLESLRPVFTAHEYDLHEAIGRGGFSVVYRVHSSRFDDSFAAKITDTSSSRHRSIATATANEQRALADLDHPHVIRMYDCFTHGPYHIIILELCSGKSLYELLHDAGHGPVPNLRPMMGQLADALAFIHAKHYVHRDIKPSNVLLDRFGRPKIADFGLCIPWKESEPLNEFQGSIYYCSPEMFAHEPFDPFKSDIWAMGITFYEMSQGLIKWPKNHTLVALSVRDGGVLISQGTPRDVARVCRAMVEMEPSKRPNAETVKTLVPVEAGDAAGRSPARILKLTRNLGGGRKMAPTKSFMALPRVDPLLMAIREDAIKSGRD
jgi:serine/threonine protein kinase